MNIRFWAGWCVAAAMVALHFFISGRDAAGDVGEGESRTGKGMIAEATPQKSAAQSEKRSAKRVEQRLEPWQRGVKTRCKDPKWHPHDKWNVPALYETLGDVPPEVRDVADRIRDAHKTQDIEAALACVADAEACPNPIVRAMMVDALRLFAIIGSGEGREASDQARLAAFDAALRFAGDSNEFVSGNAVNTLAVATRHISNDDERLGMIADAVKATGGDILEERDFKYGVLSRYRNKDEDRDMRLLVIAQAIEELPEGEVRSRAENIYSHEVGEKFAGTKGVMEKIAWKDDLAETGTQLFDNNREKGSEFAKAVDIATLRDEDALDGKEAEVEEASRMFSTPWIAMNYVTSQEHLRKEAVRRYGEGPKADEWYARELEFHEKRMHKFDERLEKAREERKRAEKGGFL